MPPTESRGTEPASSTSHLFHFPLWEGHIQIVKKMQRNGNAALHRIYAPISLNKFPHFTELGPDLEMIPAYKTYT